jgi:ribosome-binding ATPase
MNLVDGSVDPERDIEVINMELILADMAQIEKRIAKCMKDQKTFGEEIEILNKVTEENHSLVTFVLRLLIN